jgi:hypothetical protein
MAWEVGHPLRRDGTSQRQRLLDLLRPENVPIDDRTPADLLLFLSKLAPEFVYYNFKNQPDGGWQAFFELLKNETGEINRDSIIEFLGQTQQRRDNNVFLSLLLAFFHLYTFLQDDINRLTAGHLKFNYEEVLGFKRKPAVPDQVHVLFELTPGAEPVRIPTGTTLRAGNDAKNLPLTYVTNREIVVNRATIDQIKSTLIAADGRIYAAEVANSADGLGEPLEEDPPKWATFGDPATMQLRTVGFAVASPLLLLQEGEREITLELIFDVADFPDKTLFEGLIAYGSGEEEWIRLEPPTADLNGSRITLTLVALPEHGGIVAYNNEVLDGNLNTVFPVLRLLLNPQRPAYQKLKDLQLVEVQLSVRVKVTAGEDGRVGAETLIVQNDLSVLDANSAFQPFGSEPAVGAHFYIGSREVFSKPLSRLDLRFQWAGLPDESFKNYYTEYEQHGFSFVEKYARFSVRDRGTWRRLGRTVDLFDGTNPEPFVRKMVGGFPSSIQSEVVEFDEFASGINRGFIRLTLQTDFLHRAYPIVFAKVAALGNSGDFPNEPYTPTLQSISLGYETTVQSISLDRAMDEAALFHILPFGSDELEFSGSAPFLPQLAAGTLYLGIKELDPPQNLHLLFQMAEGSADSTNNVLTEDIEWHYLTASGWRDQPLSGGEIFIDTTEGLQKSGIIAVSIGSDATKDATLLPTELHWLRAQLKARAVGTLPVDPAGAARAIDIHPQAITAEFADSNNDPNHLRQPLEADRITALVESNSAIGAVSQPYASFGGVVAEPDEKFFTRVSERLRHKQRAAGLWDYERLVLEGFPQIYKVKTLPHTGYVENQYNEFLPGQTTVVVIPQLRNQNAVNFFQPRVSVALVAEIRRYLRSLTTFFIGNRDNSLHVINPRYEPIQLSMSVGFRESFDGGFYAEVLNDALRRFLSPWAFEEGVDIQFGGKVYKSQLLAFVEEQDYVDYVTDFKLFHVNAGPGIGEMCVQIDFVVRSNSVGNEVEVATATTEASILVSADQHEITVLQPGVFPCDEPDICGEGIGCWYVDIDFIVS